MIHAVFAKVQKLCIATIIILNRKNTSMANMVTHQAPCRVISGCDSALHKAFKVLSKGRFSQK